MLTSERASFPLAERLKQGTASLGEVFTFLSGLYFRGKLAYATIFANPPEGAPGVLIITPGCGLREPDERIDLSRLKSFAAVDVHEKNTAYRDPFEKDARRIAELMSTGSEVVLLGSIATPKYVEVLTGVFGDRLRFPADFVGRGDMSRGGLLLRCVDSHSELSYVEVSGAVRRGPRPPRLPKRTRSQ
jgi:hypothetical protein